MAAASPLKRFARIHQTMARLMRACAAPFLLVWGMLILFPLIVAHMLTVPKLPN